MSPATVAVLEPRTWFPCCSSYVWVLSLGTEGRFTNKVSANMLDILSNVGSRLREDIRSKASEAKGKGIRPKLQAKLSQEIDGLRKDLDQYHENHNENLKSGSQFESRKHTSKERPMFRDLYFKLKRPSLYMSPNTGEESSRYSSTSSVTTRSAFLKDQTGPAAKFVPSSSYSPASLRQDDKVGPWRLPAVSLSPPCRLQNPNDYNMRNISPPLDPEEVNSSSNESAAQISCLRRVSSNVETSSARRYLGPRDPVWSFANIDQSTPEVLETVDRERNTPQRQALPEDSTATVEPTSSKNMWTCVACADELPRDDFGLLLTSSCRHINSACIACVQQWISAQLEEQSWNNISCIECSEVMQYEDVKRHADLETFQRFDDLAALSVYNNDPDFVWCLNAECGAGQVHEGGDDMPIFHCRMCDHRYCIRHQVPWHVGETCQAFERRMDGENTGGHATEMDEATARLIEAEGSAERSSDLRNAATGPGYDSPGNAGYDPQRSVARSIIDRLRERNDGILAKSLQVEFEEDEWRRQADMQSKRENECIRKKQAAADDAAARMLQKTFEEEERQRKAEVEAERERKAYQQRKEDEKRGEETVYQISKKCPKCQWSIQKIDGCEHVSTLPYLQRLQARKD